MVKVMFVDDESNVLDAMRRAMRALRSQWDMRFALCGADALADLAQCPADVIVADMRMPGMDGAQLLQEVKRLHPATIRFVLSGHAEPSALFQAAATAHQYLVKPCDTDMLKSAIGRALSLRQLLADARIAEWAGAAEALPSLPAAYQRIVGCLRNHSASIADVAAVVEDDPAITAMLFKLANSAFFGARQTIRTTERAVSFLGIDNVAALVLGSGLFKPARPPLPGTVDMESLWRHSVQTATIARALALHEKWSPAQADDAFLAGMLHDLGHLVIAAAGLAGAADAARDAARAAEEIDHARMGAYLVGLWGFPDELVEAIAFHHQPSRAATSGLSLPALLHAANLLAHDQDRTDAAAGTQGMDEECFGTGAMRERWQQWRQFAAPAACATPGAGQ